eukprot:GDKI01038287.1.p1 GENE.GDKI01038287.1~~GDKI01038287.1.p1  ORF type:complete len:261 (-),score=35.41 GDKI01038287.1:336-1118(-)
MKAATAKKVVQMGWKSVKGYDCFLQCIFSGVTNICMLPSIIRSYQSGYTFEATIGIFTMITSSIYHFTQTLECTFLGVDEGKWHQMDNVFALCNFCFVVAEIAPVRTRVGRELWHSVCVGVIVIAQIMKPWDVRYTIGPLLAAALFSLCHFIYLARKDKRPKFDTWQSVMALLSLCGAIFFFIRGLDDHNDWLRLNHGMWHVFVSLFAYCVCGLSRSADGPVHARDYLEVPPHCAYACSFKKVFPVCAENGGSNGGKKEQ